MVIASELSMSATPSPFYEGATVALSEITTTTLPQADTTL